MTLILVIFADGDFGRPMVITQGTTEPCRIIESNNRDEIESLADFLGDCCAYARRCRRSE